MDRILERIRGIGKGGRRGLVVGLVAVLLVGYFVVERERGRAMVVVGAEAGAYVPQTEPMVLNIAPPVQNLIVYISGQVHNPGVFEFAPGARIVDAVEAAGGFTDYADPNAINLAARLADAQHIVVFHVDDNIRPNPTQPNQNPAEPAMVNINTADTTQLQTLPGIGPVTAGNIISHREARGGFFAIEEIQNVSGIGPVTFANISSRITVD